MMNDRTRQGVLDQFVVCIQFTYIVYAMLIMNTSYAMGLRGRRSRHWKIDSISIYPTKRGVWGGEASPRSPFARRSAGGAAARATASEPEGSFGGPLALQTSQFVYGFSASAEKP